MRILIIDNYDSFVYNLAQYVGELGGEPIVYRIDKISMKEAVKIDPDRIILSSGPEYLANKRYFSVCTDILVNLSRTVPTLGICLGHRSIVLTFGGRVIRAEKIAHGKMSLILHDGLSIFKNIENPFRAIRYHSLTVDKTSLPSCLKVTARALDDGDIMGVRHTNCPIEGIQFHPESILTNEGKKIIKNFLDVGVDYDS